MKNKYEITEKQLAFLEDFLERKYPNISQETRIELIDHLISDFENTTENGNLSQYLSNEIEFIRKFAFSGMKEIKKTYNKQTWKMFFSFFNETKFLPITAFVIFIFYFLAENLSVKTCYIILILTHTIIFGISVFSGTLNKKLRKLEEVKYLGAEIWLPFSLIQIIGYGEVRDLLLPNSFFFTIFSSFVIIYSLAALIVLKVQKKKIYEKYKYLLN